MSKYSNASVLYTSQGGAEAMIGDKGASISVTIDGARLGSSTAKIKVVGPSLYARRTASPYKAVPFMNSAVVAGPTNTTNATVDIPDADAVRFRVNDACTYYDVSASALYATETKTISAIGAAGSGGAGETTITFTGVWTTAPVATDLLVVSDGAQLSANVIVIAEDVEFDGATDFASHGYVTGVFQKSKMGNTTYFVQADNQNLELINMQ